MEECQQQVIKLSDDEGFTLADAIARREIYRPLHSIADGGGGDVRPIRSITSFNITKNHFKFSGAASFSDLKDNVRSLNDLIFNGLSFATDKKPRPSQTVGEKKNTRARQQQEKQKRQQGQLTSSEREEENRVAEEEAAEREDDGMDVEAAVQPGEKRFLGGSEHLRVEIETLVEKTEREDRLKVAGYRYWIYDSSTDAKELDLLTKGLKECFIESHTIYNQIQADLTKHELAQQRAKKGQKKVLEISPKYQYTAIKNDSLFLNHVSEYFTSDDNHTTSHQQKGEKYFVDKRKFITSHGNQEKLGAKQNTMSSIFSKEQAMFSHVEQANICLEQRCLESYYGTDIEEIEQAREEHRQNGKNPLRLEHLYNERQDSEFQQYPYPSITYRIQCERLSHELFSSMPLPHRIGSYLYNQVDQELLEKGLEMDRFSGGDCELVNEEEEELKRKTPLGLHDTEQEITVDHFQLYPQQLSSVMKECMRNGHSITTLSPTEFSTFRHRVSTRVHQDLILLNENIKRPKKDYLVQAGLASISSSLVTTSATAAAIAQEGFRSTTRPDSSKSQRDKKYAISRRLANLKGLSNDEELRERNHQLTAANAAFYQSFLGKYRPIEATIENVLACVGKPKYEVVFMERDFSLVLDELNQYGFRKIDEEFFDPETGQVRDGMTEEYHKVRRIFREAITVEWWNYFFTNGRASMAHEGIRDELTGNNSKSGKERKKAVKIGIILPLSRFNRRIRPYHAFKQWIYAYFSEYCAINHHYKIMNALYFAKFHHCRSYAPNSKDPKLNIVLHGQGMGGKSHRLDAVKQSCPSNVAESITHWTNQVYNVDQNMNDMLIINEEISNKLVAPSGNKNSNGSSEAANDDARNNFKERTTAQTTTTMSFFFDEETGDRRMKISKCMCQNVMLAATNNDLTYADPNVMSRFIVISVPRSKNEIISTRAQDKMKPQAGTDTAKNDELVGHHKFLHCIYFMVEGMTKSGLLGDTNYGVSIDSAQTLITEILDILDAKYGIRTNDVRKRKHVIEMARCMCIAYAVWYGLTSPLTRHLFHDEVTGLFVGLNPRVLLDGIAPQMVIVTDMVIDSLTTLTYLWGHEFIETILENVTTKICKLDELREEDFGRKARSDAEKGGIDNSAVLSTAADVANKRKTRVVGDLNAQDDDTVIDYNYITFGSRSQSEIHSYISNNITGDLCIAPQDISKVFHELNKTYIENDGYVMGVGKDGQRRLVRSDNPKDRGARKTLVYGKDTNNKSAVAISVAYLKQKLPYILKDDIIEDLSLPRAQPEKKKKATDTDSDLLGELSEKSVIEWGMDDEVEYSGEEYSSSHEEEEEVEEEEEEKVEEKKEIDMEVDDKLKEWRDQMMDIICIRENSGSETSMVKAIRYVMENNIFQRYPTNHPDQERMDCEDYMDVDTGTVPWNTFVTAEHPPSLMIDRLYPDLWDKYASLPKHNEEVPLVEEMSILQLRRKKNGPPLVIYNYNTVTPITRACLSTFTYKEEKKNTMAIENPDDPFLKFQQAEEDALMRDENYRRELTKRKLSMFSETPVFEVDWDLDYIACQTHLMELGLLDLKHPKGRLINYPPHVYMDLVDHNDKYHKDDPIVPIYQNLEHKIATTRTIIEGKISKRLSKNGTKYSSLMFANYSRNDTNLQTALLMRNDYGDAPIRRNRAMVERDQSRSESNIVKLGQSVATKRKMRDVTRIMTRVSNITTKASPGMKTGVFKQATMRKKKSTVLSK